MKYFIVSSGHRLTSNKIKQQIKNQTETLGLWSETPRKLSKISSKNLLNYHSLEQPESFSEGCQLARLGARSCRGCAVAAHPPQGQKNQNKQVKFYENVAKLLESFIFFQDRFAVLSTSNRKLKIQKNFNGSGADLPK